MKIYVTSKNSGPSWVSESKSVLYIGTSLTEALEAVGDFLKYKVVDPKPLIGRYPYLYSAIPEKMPRKVEEFFASDGWWYSVVSIEIGMNLDAVVPGDWVPCKCLKFAVPPNSGYSVDGILHHAINQCH